MTAGQLEDSIITSAQDAKAELTERVEKWEKANSNEEEEWHDKLENPALSDDIREEWNRGDKGRIW